MVKNKVMNRWRTTKNHTTFKKAYRTEYAIYGKRWKAFWEALDTVCEGNVVYDFYWWFIWSNFKKLFGIPKRIHRRLQFRKERIKYSVANEDIWGWDEAILDYFDNGFRMFAEQTWGKDVASWTDKQWSEWDNSSHDHKLYNKIVDFQKNMEGLRAVRQRLEDLPLPKDHKLGEPLPEYYSQALFDLNNDEVLCITSAWKNLSYILNKYHWELWT